MNISLSVGGRSENLNFFETQTEREECWGARIMCNKSATNCRTLKIKAPLYCKTSNAARTPSLDKLLHCHIKILDKYRDQSLLLDLININIRLGSKQSHQSRPDQESSIVEIITNH